MSSGHDFNHKVALASGLRSLHSGRLRQAEEQFRYLVSAFPHDAGGYRGLAKVLVRLDSHSAALEMLRAGASTLSKAGERAGAITLLREAVQLAPRDMAVHRRLGAALALAGNDDAAIREYRRFIDLALAAGDLERAKLEALYAREMLPPSRDLSALLGEVEGASDPARAAAAGSDGDRGEAGEALCAQHRATRLIASRDPGAAAATVDAARRLLGEGRVANASDLLIDAIAAGIGGHDAQVLLVKVAHRTGRRDAARTKYALLARKLRLEGEAALAEELDQLSRTV